VIHSHGSENVNATPSRISRRIGWRGAGTERVELAASSTRKLTKKVRLSARKAQPGPADATISPPMTGPVSRAPWRENERRVLPCTRMSAGTSSGMIAPIAGMKNAPVAPKNAASM